MSFKALQDYTFHSKYARYNPELKRRDTWNESINRIQDMHLEYFKDNKNFDKISPLIKETIEHVKAKRILGSQRVLQFSGAPILNKHARLYNCSSLYIDRIRSFQECMWLLLAGCGVGFSVQFHHIAKLPKLINRNDLIIGNNKIYQIEDSIEGWANAIGALVGSYLFNPDFANYYGQFIEFDYSLIRPKGSSFSHGVGKAPGPEPLRICIEKIRKLLDSLILSNIEKLHPIHAYDIIMFIADAAVSGGVRRCLPEYSKVHTKNGMISIKNIEIGTEVLTSSGYCKVTNKFDNGIKNIIKVINQDGWFECTPNHKIAILTAEDKYEWKYAKDLIKNDRMIAPSIGIEGSQVKLPEFIYSKPLHSTTCKNIIIPEFTKEIAWLLGYIQGNGYVRLTSKTGSVSVAIPNNYPEIFENYTKIISLFGVNYSINKYENYKVIIVKSKQLGTYFSSWLKQPKTELNVPYFIWNAKQDLKLSYIHGVMDADGSVKNRPTTIVNTVYKNFAKQIQLLLSSCGVQSRFKYCSRKGLKDNWQSKYSIVLINSNSKKIMNNSFGIKQCIINNSEKFTNSYPKEFHNKSYPNDYTWSNTNNKLIPVRVLEIIDESKQVQTYDLEIEEKHEFFCEGYLVHNSATISLFSSDDEEMMNAKTGDWLYKNPQRGRSNNSALLIRNKTSFEQFDKLFQKVKQFGEPGFIWSDSTECVFNPCVEVSMFPALYNNETNSYDSGVQLCNLTEINGKKCKTLDDFLVATKYAAILGTLQAAYTNFEYLGSITEKIVRREALLGVSITGVMDSPEILLNPEYQKQAAELAVLTNKQVAELIGINQSARVTNLKPAGSTSCILGTSSGIHPHHAKKYIRRVQSNLIEPPYQFFSKYNPRSVEISVWSTNKTDGVVSFCIEVPEGSRTKKEVSAIKLLENVKLTQNNWVKYGTNIDLCTQPWLRHNVSNTINVKPDEWEEVENYIYNNRESFAGIALLSHTGDLDYPQAPFTAIHTPIELVKMYGDASLMASGLIVDGLDAFNGDLWVACDQVLGHVSSKSVKEHIDDILQDNSLSIEIQSSKMKNVMVQAKEQEDWIRRAKQFATRYFDNDIRKMTYCLKEVSNWKLWVDLQREYKDVDFTQLFEDSDNTKIQETIACAGGACSF